MEHIGICVCLTNALLTKQQYVMDMIYQIDRLDFRDFNVIMMKFATIEIVSIFITKHI